MCSDLGDYVSLNPSRPCDYDLLNPSRPCDLTVRQLITPPRNCQPPDVRISRNKTYKNHIDSDKYLQ